MLEYSRALDVEADYLTDLVEAASGHLAWATADMWRKNFDSVLGRSSKGLDPNVWISPMRDGGTPTPPLVARYEALGKLPQNTFGKALWDFDKRNGYPSPGDPTALNAAFGTAHDPTHVISDYDTSARGELLVSTFTAGMHPINPMSGHILPVIFFFHFGEQLNDVGHGRHGRPRPRRVLARPGARRRDDRRHLRSQVERGLGREDLEDLRREWNVTPAGRQG